MAFSLAGDHEEVMSAINTTPLVDVMLVLLIIFLITIPVVTHTVRVDLPQERNQPRETKPEDVTLSVDRNGNAWWNELMLKDRTELADRLREAAGKDPQPVLQIRGDGDADYAAVGRVVFAAQRAGIHKVGFLTEPPAPQ
jgi:biopolymer transport protein ExbD